MPDLHSWEEGRNLGTRIPEHYVHEDALALLMFFFTSFSFVLVILAGILWRYREGEFLLLAA
jgi:hypothetical protein